MKVFLIKFQEVMKMNTASRAESNKKQEILFKNKEHKIIYSSSPFKMPVSGILSQ